MRIRELHQRRFGRFTDDVLELIPDRDDSLVPGLHVIYGGNEAGKTTALYAIRYGLYGIPDLRNDPRSYDFLHRKPELRIAMVIDSAAGERIGFTRRKKRGDSCFDITDTSLAPDLQKKLERLLRGIDRNLFTYKYGIDHETLRVGGAGLAGEDSDLGESLFAAATGIVGVRVTLSSLAAQIDDLLRSTGRAGQIHDAVKRHNEARIAADRARTAGRGLLRKQQEIEKAVASLEATNSVLAAATAERERATRVQGAIGQVVQRGLTLDQIDELGVVIDTWSADLEGQRKNLRNTVATSEQALLAATSELAAQMGKHAQCAAAVDETVLGTSDRVRHLGERIAEYLSAKGERSKLAAALKEGQQGVAMACLAIRPGADPDQARALIPPLPAREAARVLLGRHADLDREARAAAEALAECESALLTVEAEFPAEPPAEPAGLEAVRTALAQTKTVDTSLLARLDQRLQVRAKRLSDDAAALPRCTHSAQTLLALQAPLEQTVDEFDGQLRVAQSKMQEHKAADAGSKQSLETTDSEIAAKAAGRDLPAVEELGELRGSRDRLWRRIRAAWAGERAADDADVIEPGGEKAIATAFEDAVSAVDTHADRLVRAGEIVGTIAALEERRSKLAVDIARNEAQLATARREQERVEAEWRALWAAIDVEPGTASEMRAWLDALRSVRDIATSIESDSIEARALRARVERARSDLSAALAAVGRPPASETISVEILEATATEMLDTADRARDAATKRDAERRHLERNREKARTENRTAREACNEWQRTWDETAPAIGLAAGSLPEAGSTMLEAIGALDEALRRLTAARSAHETNHLVVTTFERDVEDLVSSISEDRTRDLSDKSADQVVREIVEAVAACRKAADALEVMAPQIEGLERQKRERQDAITSATDRLEGLTDTAQLASVDELDTAAARWTEREDLRMQLAMVEQRDCRDHEDGAGRRRQLPRRHAAR